jgi:nucleotide-binding universal stress UspA family protein
MGSSTETDGSHRPRVVVGIDGSPGSRAALAWAMEAAAATGATVEAVTAFAVDFYWTDPYLADPGRVDAITADTRALAAGMVGEARAAMAETGATAPDVELVVVPGPAPQHLVHQSRGADLLVVGSRGRGGVASTLLGSVALHCSAHARCPVVVVHPTGAERGARVVVGLDDSVMSRAALRAAADEALRLRTRLDVVVAFQPYDSWSELYAVMMPPWGETREHAEQHARQTVSEILGEEADRLLIRVVAEEGVPGDVLVRAARGARLLVVGSLSRSRLEGMVLGSVALHCVVHAPCPVMVVHPPRHPAEPSVPAQRAPAATAPSTPVA